MNNIKVGDILKYKDGDASIKVLGICGDVYFLSEYDDYNICDTGYTLKEIEEYFILPESKYEPKNEEEYYWINSEGEICLGTWYDYNSDNNRKGFLGIFPTEAEAKKRLEEIKILLKGN